MVMVKDVILNIVEGMLEKAGFTPKTLAEKVQISINEKIIEIAKDKKPDGIQAVFFLVTQNGDIDKEPLLQCFGTTKGGIKGLGIFSIREIIDGLMDNKTKGMVKMAESTISGFTLNGSLNKMYVYANTQILSDNKRIVMREGMDTANISLYEKTDASFFGKKLIDINLSDYAPEKLELPKP